MLANYETQLPQDTRSSDSMQFGMSLEPLIRQVDAHPQPSARDAIVQNFLGTDYEYAKEQGIIDAFYVNPETGEDGLMHVLAGTIATGPTGTEIPAGFHHEPSALDESTFVDREHLEGADYRRRRDYREFEFEPYRARVVIGGLKKMTIHKKETGDEIAHANSHMFPKEYDQYTVLKTIVDARDNRDATKDKLMNSGDKILAEGTALMLDGKTSMELRMILDLASGKVISAFPARIRHSGFMKLQPTEILEHLGLL